ncbi:MAG: hypothetical protein K2O92_01625 [Lachnospiraceae bacterium]|nr:hypothetical protein [Lachnospiraceae bacterium]
MSHKIKKIIKRNRQQIVYTMAGINFILVIISAVYTIRQLYIETNIGGAVTTMAVVTASPKPSHEKIIVLTPAPEKEHSVIKEHPVTKEYPVYSEESIFTFLQGPKSWENRIDWSGSWGQEFYDGGSFGGFGCGLCCLANVYSTISTYQCNPVDMYNFTRNNTGYGGGGAIAWDYMDTALNKLGFSTSLKLKPDSYKTFRKHISEAECSIVLISSNNSRCYWTDTPGHYVTIFSYNKENDTVFLADSGDPDHNRQRVGLDKIYKSLKTASQWQYLIAGNYNSRNDTWKHKKSDGNWVKPGYIQ